MLELRNKENVCCVEKTKVFGNMNQEGTVRNLIFSNNRKLGN